MSDPQKLGGEPVSVRSRTCKFSRPLTTIALNLCVTAAGVVKLPFHRASVSDILTVDIYNSQQKENYSHKNKFMVGGVTTTQGIV